MICIPQQLIIKSPAPLEEIQYNSMQRPENHRNKKKKTRNSKMDTTKERPPEPPPGVPEEPTYGSKYTEDKV